MNNLHSLDTHWLPRLFGDDIFSTTTMIMCCDADKIAKNHASAVAWADKLQYIVVDVDIGQDPREAIFYKISRESNVAAAVEARLKKTNRRAFIVIRDASRFANNETGLAILWSLKSARDRVEPRLRLLFFGSDRAALQTFVTPKSAPFLDSKVLG